VLVQQRKREARPVAEPAEDGAFPDAGLLGDHVHRDVFDPVPGCEPLGRVEDLHAVPGGVGAFRRRAGDW
jgi:hypothetical protein